MSFNIDPSTSRRQLVDDGYTLKERKSNLLEVIRALKQLVKALFGLAVAILFSPITITQFLFVNLKIVYKFGILINLFAFMVTQSFAGATSDVRAVNKSIPDKLVTEVWPNVGEMPIYEVKDVVKRTMIRFTTLLFKLMLKLPRPTRRWKNVQEAKAGGELVYGEDIFQYVPEASDEDLSDKMLYTQVVVGGFYDIKPLDAKDSKKKHLMIWDLTCMEPYPVRPQYTKYGGKIVVNTKTEQIEYMITPEQLKLKPGDRTWAKEKIRFRCTIFAYLTFVPHTIWSHGLISPKFFTATHSLPRDHHLFNLLKPFVHDINRNVTRAKVTVFGETGVLTTVSAMTPEGHAAIMKQGRNFIRVKLLKDLHLVPELEAALTPIWDAMTTLVTNYVKESKIDAKKDPKVAAFKNYIAENVHRDFNDLTLVETIVYLMFTSIVSHHVWGHLYYGNPDSRYVSTHTASNYEKVPDNDLWKMAERAQATLIRYGVIVSTRRAYIKLNADLYQTTNDPILQQHLLNFQREVDTHIKHSDVELHLERLASSGML